jgi:hypothetical protein
VREQRVTKATALQAITEVLATLATETLRCKGFANPRVIDAEKPCVAIGFKLHSARFLAKSALL